MWIRIARVVAVASLLAGCGGDDSSATGSETSESTTPTSQTSESTTQTSESTAPSPGGGPDEPLLVTFATTEQTSPKELEIVRDLMSGRLSDLGVADPNVSIDGENILVDLTGVGDQEDLLDALQVSGIVTLRPVIQCGTDLTADEAAGIEVLPFPGEASECLVGPSEGTGEVFEQGGARAALDQQTGQWVVNADLSGDGEVIWNAIAQECFNGTGVCPSRQLAIVLDDVVQAAPIVQIPDFPGTVQISGAFSEDEVRGIARVLNRGAFPAPVSILRIER